MQALYWQRHRRNPLGATAIRERGGNYQRVADPTGEDGNLSVDPLLVDLSIDKELRQRQPLSRVGSPLVEAGDPEITTEDGRRSFIGAFNRLDLEDTDGDGDGFTVILEEDFDDADSTTTWRSRALRR